MQLNLPSDREIVNAVGRLDQIRGAWAAGTPGIPSDRLERLRQVAKVQSIGASCRIAGFRVGDDEVASILRGDAIASEGAAEILGYSRAMDREFPRAGTLVTPQEIRSFHATVIGNPDLDPAPSGLREEPLHLEAFDAEGRALGRVFQTLPPRLLADKLDEMCTWLELELRGGEQHPLLVIGSFLLMFVATSPFPKGNTRAARSMTIHLLRRAGYAHVPYASFERVLEESRVELYDAIDAASTRLWSGNGDLKPWLRFFLNALGRHADRVEAKIDLERRALDLPPLQRAILETVREHGTVQASHLLASTGTNRNTLKDNLRRLVDRGILERVGQKRGTFYRLPTGESSANH
jgi:Fic family protein